VDALTRAIVAEAATEGVVVSPETATGADGCDLPMKLRSVEPCLAFLLYHISRSRDRRDGGRGRDRDEVGPQHALLFVRYGY
jgi:hypothetical protein